MVVVVYLDVGRREVEQLALFSEAFYLLPLYLRRTTSLSLN